MEILKLVVIVILISNVNTLYLQPIDVNITVVSHTDKTNATKNLDPLHYNIPSNETKVGEVEMKFKPVEILKSFFGGASPLQEIPEKIAVETDSVKSVKSSFHYESPSREETTRKAEVEMVIINVKSSVPPNKLSKEESTKVIDVQNINHSVLGKNSLYINSSKISEGDSKLIATGDETGCENSTSHCASLQKCTHGNVCTYVLIFASSLYFYYTVGAFV